MLFARHRNFLGLLAILLGCVFAVAVAPAPAAAKGKKVRPLQLGYLDGGVFGSSDAGVRAQWLDQAASDRAQLVLRIIAWRQVAPKSLGGGFNPGDPGYSWGPLDQTIKDTATRGLDPLVTVTSAPSWPRAPVVPARR